MLSLSILLFVFFCLFDFFVVRYFFLDNTKLVLLSSLRLFGCIVVCVLRDLCGGVTDHLYMCLSLSTVK